MATMNKEKADYLGHSGLRRRQGIIRHDNKFDVFNRYGDAIWSGSTRDLGNAAKDILRRVA